MTTNSQDQGAQAQQPFIVRFYGEGAVDGEGRNLDEILDFDDDKLEGYHDFIQVIFPVRRSQALQSPA